MSERRPDGQLRIGLTGGIGSGKSTVAGLLAQHGAYVIGADRLAREVVEPGTPGLAAVVERFGAEVLDAHGALDRAALGRRVFGDDAARAQLNAIIHPLVAARSAELMDASAADAVVVYDIPLLVETGRQDEFDAVVTVTASLGTRLSRLADRGLLEADARARIAAQASDEQRAAVSWATIDNDGSRAELAGSVTLLWDRLLALRG